MLAAVFKYRMRIENERKDHCPLLIRDKELCASVVHQNFNALTVNVTLSVRTFSKQIT